MLRNKCIQKCIFLNSWTFCYHKWLCDKAPIQNNKQCILKLFTSNCIFTSTMWHCVLLVMRNEDKQILSRPLLNRKWPEWSYKKDKLIILEKYVNKFEAWFHSVQELQISTHLLLLYIRTDANKSRINKKPILMAEWLSTLHNSCGALSMMVRQVDICQLITDHDFTL